MVSIAYCSAKKNAPFEEHLKQSSGITDIEILCFESPSSFSAVYNQALDIAAHDIIVFIQDDIEFIGKGWAKRLTQLYQKSEFATIGVAGSLFIPASCCWWEDQDHLVGRVWQMEFTQKWEVIHGGPFEGRLIEVLCLDGVFLSCHRKRLKERFDQRYEGETFFDLDFVYANVQKGAKSAVTYDFEIISKKLKVQGVSWDQNHSYFLSKFSELPEILSPDIIIDKAPVKLTSTPKVSVIVAHAGTVLELLSCIESIIEKSSYSNMEILIMDLQGKEEDKEAIDKQIEKHSFIKMITFEDRHLLKAYNYTAQNVVAKDSELLLFLNEDVIMLNDAISHLVAAYLENPSSCGAIGGRLHSSDNRLRHFGFSLYSVEAEGGFELAVTMKGIETDYGYKNDTLHNVAGVSGALLMIHRNLFEKVGGYNCEYINRLADLELCLSCIREGMKNHVAGKGVCYLLQPESKKLLKEDFSRMVDYINTHSKELLPYVELIYSS